jgi:hypothetical protein
MHLLCDLGLERLKVDLQEVFIEFGKVRVLNFLGPQNFQLLELLALNRTAVAIRAARNKLVGSTPGYIVDVRQMQVADHCQWLSSLSRVEQYLVA